MKTVGSRIVMCTMFGIVYYAADKVLTDVEATINASVTTNLLVARKHVDATGLSGSLIASGKTLGQAMSGGDLSLSKNVSGTDSGILKNY